LRKLAPEWWRAARKASPAVLLLVSVATVMADAGMVRTVAVGVAEVTGDVYPALAGVVGALGSFVTGSTTSSNALFAALQADIAEVIDVPPVLLVAAQLAGGNVGNAVAPVVVVLGAAAVGVRDRVGEVLRLVLLPAAVLLASVIVTTTVLAALLE
jgi:lactate permease